MLKEPDLARYSTRRTHRTYTRQFKAELVAACQQPVASIAAIAGGHGMNANVLHRWLKEHERNGCHQLVAANSSGSAVLASPTPAFIALKLPTCRAGSHSLRHQGGTSQRYSLDDRHLAHQRRWRICAMDPGNSHVIRIPPE